MLESSAARKKDSATLESLVSRLDRLEESHQPAVPVARGRGILRTPLKSSPTVGGLSTVRGEPRLSVPDYQDELAASDLVNGLLTQVLKQLSIAIDPTPQSSTKGLLLRPEYYVQHVDKGVAVKSLDHTKLSFKEMISGMGRVMTHLSTSGGELTSYVRHFNFVAMEKCGHNSL